MPVWPKPIPRYLLVKPTPFGIFILLVKFLKKNKPSKQCLFHRFIVKKNQIQKTKFRSLFPNLTKLSILEPKIHGLKTKSGLRDFLPSPLRLLPPKWFLVKIYDPRVFKQKNGFSKNRGEATLSRYSQNPKIGRMRTPFDTSKISKLQGSDTSSILAKFQKPWRHNIPS